MTPRIQIMLDSRQIETRPAPDEEVVGMWGKAIRSLQSASLPDLDPDSAFTLTYQGAMQAATAIVRAAGYRVIGDGHHQNTFGAVAALDAGELSEAARGMNIIRQRRHEAVYDWEARTQGKELVALRSATLRLVDHGRQWLEAQRPHLSFPSPS